MTVTTRDLARRAVTAPDRSPVSAVLSMSMISKRFAGVHALSEVSLQVAAGSVHGLVGGNGAGKSTLIKIATGAERPDSGAVYVAPGADSERRIAAIYQELTIVPEMTALQNVFLGAPRHRYSILSRGRMLAEFSAMSARLQANIEPSARAGGLCVADQQLLEIMRALVNKHRVIVMDEPTAALGARERKNLYRIIAELKAQGTAVIYIGHDLDEVLLLSDHITVLRNGRLVWTRPAAGLTREAVVMAMLDGNIPQGTGRGESNISAAPVLTVRNFRPRGAVVWNFDLHRGEMLGIGGLVGSGRTSLLRALAGLEGDTPGSLEVNGIQARVPRSVREALSLGIALAPEDRKQQGLVLTQSGRENLCLTNLGAIATAWIVSRSQRAALAHRQADAMAFARARLGEAAGKLSGGNQQKLVIGKWLSIEPTALLLDEPTRGIDVAARAEIYRTIRTLCGKGMSVIVVSSDLSELSQLCDRVIVIGSDHRPAVLCGQDASVDAMTRLLFASTGSTGVQ